MAVTSAFVLASHKMLKVSRLKILKVYRLKHLIIFLDNLLDVRYCSIISTHLSDLEVKVTDLEFYVPC